MTLFKALTLAATMTLTAGSALAMGCNYGKHEQQVQSCIAGTSWDAASQACVPTANS